MEFPNSPFFLLERLLDEFRSGQRTSDNVLESLDAVHDYVEQLTAQMLAFPVQAEVFPEGHDLAAQSVAGFERFADAAELIREYVESGEEARADQALEVAHEGHETLVGLFTSTYKKVQELQNEVG